MCKYIETIDTKTQFIILMHPKEFKKTKNGTGHFTNLSLSNCEYYVGIDFNEHRKINSIIDDSQNNCYVLYPDDDSINLNTQNINIENKTNVVFIIDSTWPCSKKILTVSKNIKKLPKISFSHTKHSQFKIKRQPNSYCLSTIESTLCILELLEDKKFDNFLNPFYKMVEYQLKCSVDVEGSNVRYKIPYKKK